MRFSAVSSRRLLNTDTALLILHTNDSYTQTDLPHISGNSKSNTEVVRVAMFSMQNYSRLSYCHAVIALLRYLTSVSG